MLKLYEHRLPAAQVYVPVARVRQLDKELYYLAWQPVLFAEGTVVRIYGCKDGPRRTLTPLPYPSLTEAWPLIRAILRQRLRHGYRIVEAMAEEG